MYEMIKRNIFWKARKLYWSNFHVDSLEKFNAENNAEKIIWEKINQKIEEKSIEENRLRILEVGCVNGRNLISSSKSLNNPSVSYVGVDINSEAIRKGKRFIKDSKIKNVELINQPATSVEMKDFDILCSVATLIYLSPLEIKRFLSNLNNSGIELAVICEPVNLESRFTGRAIFHSPDIYLGYLSKYDYHQIDFQNIAWNSDKGDFTFAGIFQLKK